MSHRLGAYKPISPHLDPWVGEAERTEIYMILKRGRW